MELTDRELKLLASSVSLRLGSLEVARRREAADETRELYRRIIAEVDYRREVDAEYRGDGRPEPYASGRSG